MGRPKRIQFPGACYYVLLRGNGRQGIFLADQDRREFLSLLRAYKEHYGLRLYAYCLLDGEAHLLLETAEPNLSLAMQALGTSYTKSFNARHGTVGHVFRGRYKALVVDKERRLSELTRFVHLQPVRAGLEGQPWRHPWSSCSAYVEAERGAPLVDRRPVLARFGKGWLKQSVRYLSYIKEGVRSAPGYALPVVEGTVVGDEAFLARLRLRGLAGTEPPDRSVEARKILSEVAASSGFDEERLLGRVLWREVSAVRRRAIHRIWKEAHMGVTDLARMFGRSPSAISQLIRALEMRHA